NRSSPPALVGVREAALRRRPSSAGPEVWGTMADPPVGDGYLAGLANAGPDATSIIAPAQGEPGRHHAVARRDAQIHPGPTARGRTHRICPARSGAVGKSRKNQRPQ